MDNNEQTLYGIPVSNLKGIEYEGGTYYKANGYCFYVPNDVDDSTPTFIYYPGSAADAFEDKFNTLKGKFDSYIRTVDEFSNTITSAANATEATQKSLESAAQDLAS